MAVQVWAYKPLEYASVGLISPGKCKYELVEPLGSANMGLVNPWEMQLVGLINPWEVQVWTWLTPGMCTIDYENPWEVHGRVRKPLESAIEEERNSPFLE